jgi:hypothetical protein
MNTADLLATIAPHAEMLKRMGWTITRLGDNAEYVYVDQYDPSTSETLTTEYAARILCDVCMEALDKWAKESCENVAASRHVTCSTSKSGLSHTASIRGTDCEPIRTMAAPTRLAALLALLAWTQEDRT